MVINLTRSQETQIKCLISLGITDNCKDRLCYSTGRQAQGAFRDQGVDNQAYPGIHHSLSADSPPPLQLTQTHPHPGSGLQGSPSFWGGRQGPTHFGQLPWRSVGTWARSGKGKGISESFELWPIPGPSKVNDQRETQGLFRY